MQAVHGGPVLPPLPSRHITVFQIFWPKYTQQVGSCCAVVAVIWICVMRLSTARDIMLRIFHFVVSYLCRGSRTLACLFFDCLPVNSCVHVLHWAKVQWHTGLGSGTFKAWVEHTQATLWPESFTNLVRQTVSISKHPNQMTRLLSP